MSIIIYPLNKGQWIAVPTDKKYIVWHATCGRTSCTPYRGQPGRATTSIDSWNDTPDRVGAPYLIDRDGTVYHTMPDEEWIYHLGLKGTNGYYDKISVGIELANECGLLKENDKYYAFDKISPDTEYTGAVVEKDWRGYNFIADFDIPQIDSLMELTLELCEKYSIEPKVLISSEFIPNCWENSTILRHCNVREDKPDLYFSDYIWEYIRSNYDIIEV